MFLYSIQLDTDWADWNFYLLEHKEEFTSEQFQTQFELAKSSIKDVGRNDPIPYIIDYMITNFGFIRHKHKITVGLITNFGEPNPFHIQKAPHLMNEAD